MRIKKKTSLMLVAASTAAVVGVAAVSFAAWSGGNDTLYASASTGSATLFGFTANTTAETALDLGTLVPYDQDQVPNTTYEGNLITSVNLPKYYVDVETACTITVTYEGNLSLYALVDNRDGALEAVPENWSEENAGEWKQITADGVAFTMDAVTIPEGATEAEVTNAYISLMLVSSDSAEMGQDFTLTVVLSK